MQQVEELKTIPVLTEVIEKGLNIKLVVADSLYGQSRKFINRLEQY